MSTSGGQDFNIALNGIKKSQYYHSKSVQKIATGLDINQAADGPAALVQSEHLRMQTAGMDQALENSEVDLNLLQTADAALASISEQLSYLKQVAIHSANTAISDPISREVDVLQVKELLQSIERIAQQTKFGNRNLLDGSSGASGTALGPFLEFISANERTASSPKEGYSVQIEERATQGYFLGADELDIANLPDNFSIKVTANGKTAEYLRAPDDNTEAIYRKLQQAIDSVGLKIVVDKSPDNELLLYNQEYGSQHFFQVSSNVEDVVTSDANVWEESFAGNDVRGLINGTRAIGNGQILRSGPGSGDSEGIVLRYAFDDPDLETRAPLTPEAGTVLVKQNSVYFQNSPEVDGGFYYSFENVTPTNLGKSATNPKNFRNLAEIDVSNESNAHSSILVIENATNQVLSMRAKLGAVQKNAIESNMHYLQVARENILAAESAIRDTDLAEEISQLLKQEIQMKNSALMLHNSAKLQNEINTLFQKSLQTGQ